MNLITTRRCAGTLTGDGDQGESALDLELVMGLLGPMQQVSLYEVGTTFFEQVPSSCIFVHCLRNLK